MTVAQAGLLDTLVTSIRRKLGARAKAIQTVRGLGYRFVDTT